jgi:glycerol kinase
MIKHAEETQELSLSVEDTGGVYLVPAFTGLGAPYWDPKARGALLGLTRDTRVPHVVRASLEAVCYQTRDLLTAMQNDGAEISTLRVDGGMTANDWLLQFLSDMLNVRVDRPTCIETSALGAAYLAGLGAGLFDSLETLSKLWHLDRSFSPSMDLTRRERLYKGWLQAVDRILER